jgi:general secretion pathway protein K
MRRLTVDKMQKLTDAINRPSCVTRNNQKGVALLMVIWVLMMLTVIVTQFCYTMRTQVNTVRNLKESVQAYYIALAGANAAMAEIVKQSLSPGDIMTAGSDEADDQDSFTWRLNMDLPPVDFAQGQYQVNVTNESGKVDINRADPRILRVILNGFDLDEQHRDIIIDSIQDWRDANDLHRPNGAETDYYMSLDPPYQCRDSDFETVDELLLVRGITPEIFYNGLEKMVTVLPSDKRGIRSSSRRKRSYDFNRININSAPEQILAGLPGMTPELVKEVQEFRKEKDFRNTSEFARIVGSDVYSRIVSYISIDSHAYFTITSMGKTEGSDNQQGVEIMIALEPEAEKRFKVVSWQDRIGHGAQAWLLQQGGHSKDQI